MTTRESRPNLAAEAAIESWRAQQHDTAAGLHDAADTPPIDDDALSHVWAALADGTLTLEQLRARSWHLFAIYMLGFDRGSATALNVHRAAAA